MAKPARSPVLGYNHNIRYHGRVFHVQTEDSGPSYARLYTHLFFEGTILSSKKHEYDGAAPEDSVKLLMQQLHKAMIKELTGGAHDERITSFFAARGEAAAPDEGPAVAAEAAPAATEPPPVAVASRPQVLSGSIETTAASSAGVPVAVTRDETRPQVTQRPTVVVKPGEVRRPPVVLSSSADGVVVQRNVVISVGGPASPAAEETPSRARPRPPIPYVVREGSYPLPNASRASGGTAPSRPADAALRARAPGAPSERTPSERAFAPDLVSDKSLDEVILEYLSDDGEAEER
jgi:hypothetical protein